MLNLQSNNRLHSHLSASGVMPVDKLSAIAYTRTGSDSRQAALPCISSPEARWNAASHGCEPSLHRGNAWHCQAQQLASPAASSTRAWPSSASINVGKSPERNQHTASARDERRLTAAKSISRPLECTGNCFSFRLCSFISSKSDRLGMPRKMSACISSSYINWPRM